MKIFERIYPPTLAKTCSLEVPKVWSYQNRVVDSIVAEIENRHDSNEQRYTGMVTIAPRPDDCFVARFLEWQRYNDGISGYSFVREFSPTEEPTQFSLQSFRDSIAITTLKHGTLQVIKEHEHPSIIGILTDQGSYFSKPRRTIQFNGYTIP